MFPTAIATPALRAGAEPLTGFIAGTVATVPACTLAQFRQAWFGCG